MDEEQWVDKFTNMGFVNLPSDWKNPQEAAFGSNTLKPGTVPEFGKEWACAASWEPPTDSRDDDPVSEGTDAGEHPTEDQFFSLP